APARRDGRARPGPISMPAPDSPGTPRRPGSVCPAPAACTSSGRRRLALPLPRAGDRGCGDGRRRDPLPRARSARAASSRNPPIRAGCPGRSSISGPRLSLAVIARFRHCTLRPFAVRVPAMPPLAIALFAAALAGFSRGYAAFGTAMIYVPLVTLAYDTKTAVVTLFLIDLIPA